MCAPHVAACKLGTQKKPPERSHESPLAIRATEIRATATGAGLRLLSTHPSHRLCEQASTSHGSDMKGCLMLTLIYATRVLMLLHCALSIDKHAGKEHVMLACHGHAAGCRVQSRWRGAAQIAAGMPTGVDCGVGHSAAGSRCGALERRTAVAA